MAKPKLVVRPVEKHISIPSDLAAKIDLRLYSELEGKVPHGAWAKLITLLLQNDQNAYELRMKAQNAD